MEPQETSQEHVQETPKTEPITSAPATTTPALSIPAAILTGAAMIAFALILVLHHSDTPSTAGTAATAQPAAPAVSPDISKVNTAGEPFIGSATAPITIAYWFDYQCPFCKQDEETALPEIITNYVNTGKVKIVFKDFAFLGDDSQTLGMYARAVWEAAPDKFYLWHKAIFDNQGTENTGWATKEKIVSITTSVLGATTTAQVSQLVATKGATYQAAMDADKAEAGKFGINGTPATLIGTQVITGAEPYATFQKAIDAELK